MTDFRKLAFVGLMGLGMASLACSSSGTTSGTGGTSGGTGGPHTGGSTGNTGGSGGASSGTRRYGGRLRRGDGCDYRFLGD